MADRLESYRSKRKLDRTPEPAGGEGPAAGDGEAPRFVVQEHDATRLHWDLRLEHDGVLASWAIPNGIPQTPDENRLAVRTEDHPLEYLDFQGVIPKGTYGAGTMKIYDRGTFELEKWRDKEVMAVFHGERIQGRYVLFHTRGKDWMIHRMDPPADPERAPFPDRLLPMYATPGRLPRDDGSHGYEIHWPGIRALVFSQPGRMRIVSAAAEDVSDRFPELRRLNRALSAHEAVLDGVITVFGHDGRPDDRLAGDRLKPAASAGTIQRRSKAHPAVLVLFDVLFLDGRSLLEVPYEERRARLEELELDGPAWRVPASHRSDGRAVLEAARTQGLPGVIAKRLDSTYEPGRRSDAWREVPADPRASSDGGDGGGEQNGERPKRARRRGARRRPGKPAGGHGLTLEALLREGQRFPAGGAEIEVEGRPLKLSNLDKVLYPATGFTKGDLIDYYVRAAPAILPHLHDRPLTLKRYPNGVEDKYFYEKQRPSHAPEWIRSERWKLGSKTVDFVIADDLPTLVWLGNLADLELHPSLSLAHPPDRPTVVAFDLDPGPPADITDCCRVALLLRGMFEQLGLECFPKTSGSKGMQVYLPLNVDDVTYRDTKPFAKAVAETLERSEPDLVVSRMSKRLRKGKVFVDWSQNDDHKTTVAVYSLRARERPTVSTPLTWEEVEAGVEADDPAQLAFEWTDVLERLDRHGDLFAPVVTLGQRLPRF